MLFDRLFTTLTRPMKKLRDGSVVPNQPVIDAWIREMERYPADLLEAAVDEVVRTHQWNTVPKIADLVVKLRPEVQKRTDWRNKVRNAKTKAGMSRQQPAEAEKPKWEPLSEKTLQLLAAARAAAAADRSNEMPVHPHEAMSERQKGRKREEAAQRRGEAAEDEGAVA